MVVSIAQIRFVFVGKILRLKTKKIWKPARGIKVLTWDSASLIAETINYVRMHVLTISNPSMKHAHAR